MITSATERKPQSPYSPQAHQQLQDRALAAGRLAGRPGPAMTLAVYNAIQRHADPHGHAFPSLARIAEKAGCSISTVSRAVAVLRDAGILSVTPGSGRTVSQYRIHYPATDRGCSPVEFRRQQAAPAQKPTRRPETPADATTGPAAPDILSIYRSPEKLRQAAQHYAMSELDLIHALRHAEDQQPRSLAAYLSRTIQRHHSGERLLPAPDAETMLHLRADLRHIRNGRALA